MTTNPRLWRQFRVALMAADALAIFLTYALADYLRCRLYMHVPWPELLPGRISSVREVHVKVLFLLPIAWPILLSLFGWYEPRWRPWAWAVRTTLLASAALGLLVAALALLFVRELFPRAQIGFLCALVPATTLLVRGITGGVGRWLSGRRQRHVLIVGTDRDAVRLRRLLRKSAFGRPTVLGHLRGFWEGPSEPAVTGAVIGSIDQLGQLLTEHVIDEVYVCAPIDAIPGLLPSIAICEEIGVCVHLSAPGLSSLHPPEIVDFHGIPMLAYLPVRHPPELLTLKRGLDIALALIAIVFLAPIMLICALLIKLTSPGPVIFKQVRSGLNGRQFNMYKFRSMFHEAEQRQAELSHLNEAREGPVFKITNDPRVTPVGRWLRRWSLDEFPQFFNVLVGDMSMVGPRPPLPSEVTQYDRWQRRRLSMRPGLTCLWQIKGRHLVGFNEWMRLDLFYIDHWSIKLDFMILFRTVSTVFGGTGA